MTYLCTTKIKIIKLEMIMKHLKIKIMSIAFMAVATSSMAQSLNKMNWLNEPQPVSYTHLDVYKRQRIYYPFILLIALLTTVSCENELPFSVKDNPPKLVMNALINADSLTLSLIHIFSFHTIVPPLPNQFSLDNCQTKTRLQVRILFIKEKILNSALQEIIFY